MLNYIKYFFKQGVKPMEVLDEYVDYRIHRDKDVYDIHNEAFNFEAIIEKMTQVYKHVLLFQQKEVKEYNQFCYIKRSLLTNLITMKNLEMEYGEAMDYLQEGEEILTVHIKFNIVMQRIQGLLENLQLYEKYSTTNQSWFHWCMDSHLVEWHKK
jgi:hypothetical protein